MAGFAVNIMSPKPTHQPVLLASDSLGRETRTVTLHWNSLCTTNLIRPQWLFIISWNAHAVNTLWRSLLGEAVSLATRTDARLCHFLMTNEG